MDVTGAKMFGSDLSATLVEKEIITGERQAHLTVGIALRTVII